MYPQKFPKHPDAFKEDISLEETELATSHILGPEQGGILRVAPSLEDSSTKGSVCAETRNNCNFQERPNNKA